MGKRKPAKSIRKFIRKEKARIRREVLDIREQNDIIKNLVSQIFAGYKSGNKEKNKTV